MIDYGVEQYRLLPPQGFRPEGEIPRRHSSNSRGRKVLKVEIYSHTVNIEKKSREGSVGNDDVSIFAPASTKWLG